MHDSQFLLVGISAYYWAIAYFILIIFEMTYGKRLTMSVKMDSVWGRVLYCNLLSMLPMLMIGYYNHDYDGGSSSASSSSISSSSSGGGGGSLYNTLSIMPIGGWLSLLFSCIVGTLIG